MNQKIEAGVTHTIEFIPAAGDGGGRWYLNGVHVGYQTIWDIIGKPLAQAMEEPEPGLTRRPLVVTNVDRKTRTITVKEL